MLIWAALAVALVGGAGWCWYHRRLLSLAARIPGPPALPIIGNALTFMARPEDLLLICEDFIRKYGSYVRFWLGPNLNVFIEDPTDIRMLLTSNKINQKGPQYEFMLPFIGPGILSGGSTWRNHRKIATPSYNKKCVSRYAEVFNREAASLADILARKDGPFDVYFHVVDCTTQCVCQTLLGLAKEESNDVYRMDEVVLKTQGMYNFIFKKMTRWWLHIPFVYWLTGRMKTQRKFINMINDFTSDVVEKRRRALQSGQLVEEDVMGVVDRFILSQEMSEQEVKWETFTLFTTSQEASAKVASGVLVFLANLPEWQDKVYNEIQEVIGEEEQVTESQLKQLQSLDMVYKETLRYLSIAAVIQRTVEEEVAVKNGELILPRGASVILPIHMLHRDPRYWEDPYKIDPSRFLPENIKKRDPNAFVPFSLGAMDCLGRVYATSLIKTLVVHVLRRVHLLPSGPPLEEQPLHVAISVKFANGYNLCAAPRRQNNNRLFTKSTNDRLGGTHGHRRDNGT